MAQGVRVLATKLHNLNSTPRPLSLKSEHSPELSPDLHIYAATWVHLLALFLPQLLAVGLI